MTAADVAKVLETYSNAIVAFITLQGLAFCYAVGTQDTFNRVMHAHVKLAIALAIVFFLTTILALYANRYLHEKMADLWGSHAEVVASVCFGKALIIGIFGTLPLAVTVAFFVL